MRKYARHIASVNMKKKGLRGINDHEKGQRSYFSVNWRDFVPAGKK